MTGWRKRTIMEMAREAGFEQAGHDSFQELTARMEAFAALVREDALAQPAPVQEPVAWWIPKYKAPDMVSKVRWSDECEPLYTTPPAAQPTPVQEKNT